MSTTSSSEAYRTAVAVASMAVTKPDGSSNLYLSLSWVPLQRRRARAEVALSVSDHVKLARGRVGAGRLRVFTECPGHPWAWRRKRREI